MPRRRHPTDRAILLAFVFYALAAAAFLTLNVPPYQNPDESRHFMRAESIGRGYLLGHRMQDGTDAGGITAPEIPWSELPFNAPKMVAERKVTGAMYDAGAMKFASPGQDLSFNNTVLYPPPLYLPEVIAVWIGKLGRMDVIQTLYLARACSALTSGALIAWALLICVRARLDGAALAIFAVATLPMSLAMQSACSQDGVTLGLAALAAALFARMRQDESGEGVAALSVCLALLAMARPPYGVLALLLVLVPAGWGARLRGFACVALVGGGWFAFTTSTVAIDNAGRGANVVRQLQVVLDAPRYVAIVRTTLLTHGEHLVREFVGQLGWLDVALPRWFVRSALACLAAVGVAALSVRGVFASVLVVVALTGLAVCTALYLTWNPVGSPEILGLQGRYFVPLAMILAGLGTTLPRVPAIRAAALAFPALALAVTMRAVVVRYYLMP